MLINNKIRQLYILNFLKLISILTNIYKFKNFKEFRKNHNYDVEITIHLRKTRF